MRERVQFWHTALLRPPAETLLYYIHSKYRGWGISAVSVVECRKAHPRARDSVSMAYTMKDGPADRTRVGPRGILAPPTAVDTASSGVGRAR